MSEGKNLISFCRKVAGNAWGAVSAEVKLLVLLGIGEKSGIHVDGTDSCVAYFQDVRMSRLTPWASIRGRAAGAGPLFPEG